MKKAFTLIELMVTIAIIIILASVGAVGYYQMVRKSNIDQARMYLQVIRAGEKVYYSNNMTYAACQNTTELRTRLGAEIVGTEYTFNAAGNPDIANNFIATAVGPEGTVTLDQDGNWGP